MILSKSLVRAAAVAAAVTLSGTAWAAGGALQPVSLSAVVVSGANPIPDVHFTLTSVDTNAPVQVEALSDKGPAKVELPAGRYKLTARYGHTTAEQEIIVDGEPEDVVVNLKAGTVDMKLLHHVGGDILRNGVTWEILTYGKDPEGKRHLVAASDQSQPRFILPEGYYLARAVNGTQQVKHTIEVTSGITYKYTVILQ